MESKMNQTLIETAMQVALNEAKEGELHKKIRTNISNEFGIDPNHEGWSTLRTHISKSSYIDAAVDIFRPEIHNHYINSRSKTANLRGTGERHTNFSIQAEAEDYFRNSINSHFD